MALDNAFPSSAIQLTTMAQWEVFFAGLGGASGVIPAVGSSFTGSLNAGTRSAVLASGAALIRGFYVSAETATSTAISAASTQNRIDRLVLRLDRSAGGAASSSPQLPALTRSLTGTWDLPICHWTSGSTGALTGLTDDRYLLGALPLAFMSTSRPLATIPGIGIETDTGRILVADGTNWDLVSEDTGWVNVPLLGNWAVGGFTPQVRRINQICYYRGSVLRTTNALGTSNTDNNLGALPAGFIPAGTHNYMAMTSSTNYVRIQLQQTSGAVAIVDQSAAVGVGSAVYLDTVYMVG